GKYLGMVFARSDYPDLQSHLEGLRAIASQAVMVGDTPIDVAITIGVDQSDEGDVSNRISSAIAAADQAREAYRPVFIISDFQADSEEWDHSLQSRLENALSENRISVKLQPKVDMQSGLFVGAEALARWTDQQRGEIPPVRFIIQCERAGRLDDLTKRVMEKSMRASIELEQRKLPSKVSVNVSAIQFVDSRIVDLVEMALSATDADPRNIMIEVTETARVENLVRARAIMEEIKALGIDFSIDDFGVGSGNLDALYGLPFDEMKIDRMFANEVVRCDRARAVVASLLDLSRAFGIRSVVEGIDHLNTFEALRDMGGDLAQGFCIARPQTLPLLCETLKLQATSQLRRAT
ncbi:MAG: EAL domain-containing protein, partial [Pseudomonadota bacterium]